jgi:hypothetical protein
LLDTVVRSSVDNRRAACACATDIPILATRGSCSAFAARNRQASLWHVPLARVTLPLESLRGSLLSNWQVSRGRRRFRRLYRRFSRVALALRAMLASTARARIFSPCPYTVHAGHTSFRVQRFAEAQDSPQLITAVILIRCVMPCLRAESLAANADLHRSDLLLHVCESRRLVHARTCSFKIVCRLTPAFSGGEGTGSQSPLTRAGSVEAVLERTTKLKRSVAQFQRNR